MPKELDLCACGLKWGHTTKHAHSKSEARRINLSDEPKAKSTWPTMNALMLYVFGCALVGALLFGIRLHYEFQERDIACKAKAFDQLQEIVLTIRQAS